MSFGEKNGTEGYFMEIPPVPVESFFL